MSFAGLSHTEKLSTHISAAGLSVMGRTLAFDVHMGTEGATRNPFLMVYFLLARTYEVYY